MIDALFGQGILELQARQLRRRAKRKLEDEYSEDEDNPSYGAGMH